MNKEISQFMEFQHPDDTETNLKWYSILNKMVEAMDQCFILKTKNFNSFTEYITANKSLDSEYAYFWNWLYDEGITYLRKTDKVFPNTEDVEDFLKYREMLLEMDTESKVIENLILSISELFKTTSNFIESYLENAIYESLNVRNFNDIRVPMNSFDLNHTLGVDENWKFYESSAKITAELLVCK